MNDLIAIIGTSICSPDADLLDRCGLGDGRIDAGLLPAALRRRASQATKLAVTAAHRACVEAGRSPRDLPSVFASVGGEIQVTDALCKALADPHGYVSPTQFHNSVHNTTAGYWSIIHGCREATNALAASDDTVAMALLEAWSLLRVQPGDLLVVCYDETWPEYLAPPLGSPPCAAAFVLSTRPKPEEAKAWIGCPQRFPDVAGNFDLPEALPGKMPVTAAIPLLQAVADPSADGSVPVSAGGDWYLDLTHTPPQGKP